MSVIRTTLLRTLFWLVFVLLLVVSSQAEVVDGEPDPTFGQAGYATFGLDRVPNGSDAAFDVVVQPDGKIVAAGAVGVNAQGSSDFAIYRLLRNGKPDPGFGSGGGSSLAFNRGGTNDDIAFAVALQPDGKIVVAGVSDGPAGNSDFAVARLTATGQPDPSFGSNGKVLVPFDRYGQKGDVALDLVVQPNGRILVAGLVMVAGPQGSSLDRGFVRLLPNGALDGTFGTGGKAVVGTNAAGNYVDWSQVLDLRPDGSLVSLGPVQVANGAVSVPGVMKLDATGNIQPGFGINGAALMYERIDEESTLLLGAGIETLQSGEVLTAFTEQVPPGAPTETDVVFERLDANGNILTSTSVNIGFKSLDFVTGLVVQKDDRSIVVGATGSDVLMRSRAATPIERYRSLMESLSRERASSAQNFVIRFNPDGSRDYDFAGGVKLLNQQALFLNATLDQGGNLILAGVADVGGNAQLGVVKLRLSLIEAEDFETGGFGSWTVTRCTRDGGKLRNESSLESSDVSAEDSFGPSSASEPRSLAG